MAHEPNTNPGAQILKLGDATMTDDGLAMAFTMETTQGDFRVHIPMRDIGNVVAFFAGAARVHEEAFGDDSAPTTPSDWATIATRGLGLATRDTHDTVELLVRLSGFDLGFEMPANELAAFFEKNRLTVQTLAASGPTQ